ncbi:MAG TPA: protein kinase, partial [Candidatus Thermoplasmatota archaeon]|nr:protein kinase [Candidatus Thermoplasmatota archaeon]
MLALAIVVARTAPGQAANRALVGALATAGLGIMLAFGVVPMLEDEAAARTVGALGTVALLAWIPLYLLLVATLDTPLARPLRTRAARGLVLAALGVLLAAGLLGLEEFVTLEPGAHTPWVTRYGPWAEASVPFVLTVLAFTLVAAVSACFLARSPAARRQAQIFTAAFGLRDTVNILYVAWLHGAPPASSWTLDQSLLYHWTPAMTELVATSLLAYGLLSTQLFDIDLRLKWTARHTTTALTFLAVFLVVSQVASVFVAPATGTLLGALGAAMLLLVLADVRRMSDRVADHLLPEVRASPAYLQGKKLEVYRAALQHALLPDGGVRPDEEPGLARLRADLGLTERDHAVLAYMLAAGPDSPGARGPMPGERVLGRYVVQGPLGTGGQGATWLCRDADVRRDVVVKVLRTPGGDDAADAMLREARALGALQHPNVVTLFHVEQVGHDAFLVMEHVDGGSLAARLRRGPLDRDEFRRVASGLLRALEAVHALGA